MNTKAYLFHNLSELDTAIRNLEALIHVKMGLVEKETITDEEFHHRVKVDLRNLINRSNELMIQVGHDSWLPDNIYSYLKKIRACLEKLKKIKYTKSFSQFKINKTNKIINKVDMHISHIEQIIADL